MVGYSMSIHKLKNYIHGWKSYGSQFMEQNKDVAGSNPACSCKVFNSKNFLNDFPINKNFLGLKFGVKISG